MAETLVPFGEAAAWSLLLALRAAVDRGRGGRALALGWRDGAWREGGAASVVPEAGGLARGRELFDAAGQAVLDSFLAQALAPPGVPLVLGVLGQTLDGFIATHSGESRSINGPAALLHLHRIRALSDAVLIGASTACLDHPRLTTRHCPGPSPTRVVIDPSGRVPASSSLFHDGAAPTLVLRAGDGPLREERVGAACLLHLPGKGSRLQPQAIVACLGARGLHRLMVEGGGRTVSGFLAAGALHRLQLMVAPFLLGSGRPGVSLPGRSSLAAVARPPCAVCQLGPDVLFDLDLTAG